MLLKGKNGMKTYVTFPDGKTKALTMSYDDGREQDRRLVALFNRFGIKGTFHLNSGWQDPELVKMRAEAPQLYSGHEIATHSLTHPTLTRLSREALAFEILEDRKNLEKMTGRIIRGHSYPNGAYNGDVKRILKDLGIAYARAVSPSNDFELPDDLMEWHPTCHHGVPDLMERAKSFADMNIPQALKLFYVWGHSYEFDRDDNWEVIEEFCRFMGEREDIWYATNLEIADYLECIRGLKFSADGIMVYNPAFQSVWLQVLSEDSPKMGRILEIPGGRQMRLV